MPRLAPTICPTCRQLRQHGQRCACQVKAKADWEASRGSPASRGYDAAWRRLRAAFLAQHPFCCHPSCNQIATDVDHIIAVRDAPHLRLEWSNLRPFCHRHHSQRTAREQGFARPKRKV